MIGTGSGTPSGARREAWPPLPAAPVLVFAALAAAASLRGPT